jgi:predicted transcriptional regulator
MKSLKDDDGLLDPRLPLPLFGGVVQAQRLVVPPQVVATIRSYRHACRLAWKLRRTRLTQRTLAELAGLYPSHVSDYFSVHEQRRELPAKHIGAVEAVLGNTVISQWLAQQSRLTVIEELQAQHHAVLVGVA